MSSSHSTTTVGSFPTTAGWETPGPTRSAAGRTSPNAVSDLSMQRSLDVLSVARRARAALRAAVQSDRRGTGRGGAGADPGYRSEPSRIVSLDADGRRFATQVVASDTPGQSMLLVRASLPPMGYATVELRDDAETTESPVTTKIADDAVVMESDRYRIEFDPAKGGTIRSLVAKSLGGREFVDTAHERRFNELRGHFYRQGRLPLERGPAGRGPHRRKRPAARHRRGRRHDCRSPVCAACLDHAGFAGDRLLGADRLARQRRASANSRTGTALRTVAGQPTTTASNCSSCSRPTSPIRRSRRTRHSTCARVGSRTRSTTRGKNIKNNVILDWVDVTDGSGDHGLALFSDHTTSYTHGSEFPLGLTLQYAGKGLWARDYRVDGPTEVRYALVPHTGRWDAADIPAIAASWQEPPLGVVSRGGGRPKRSLIDRGQSGWAAPAMFERDGALFVRLFNASGDDTLRDLGIGFDAGKIELVELDGRVIEKLQPVLKAAGRRSIRLRIPRFGIRTLRFSDVKSAPTE